MRILVKILACVVLFSGTVAKAEVIAVYSPVAQAKYQALSTSLREGRLLEGVASVISANVRVPGVLYLVAAECGKPNASYNPSRRAIVLCYELMEEVTVGVMKYFASASAENVADTTAATLFFVLFHEVGHALVHLLDLPIFAREEDIADAIATYFQLRGPKPFHSILGATWFFRQREIEYSNRHFGGEHSLGPQRQMNIVCFAFGSDSVTFGPLAQHLGLPRERAERCAGEYERLEASVRKQLGRYLLMR